MFFENEADESCDGEEEESCDETYGIGHIQFKLPDSIINKGIESKTLPHSDISSYVADNLLGKRGLTEVYDRATLESWLNADILQEVTKYKKCKLEEDHTPIISVFLQNLAPAPP